MIVKLLCPLQQDVSHPRRVLHKKYNSRVCGMARAMVDNDDDNDNSDGDVDNKGQDKVEEGDQEENDYDDAA